MFKCQKCNSKMYYDTNQILVCPECDKDYFNREFNFRKIKKWKTQKFIKDLTTAFDYENWSKNYNKQLNEEITKLREENYIFRQLLQSVLDFGRLYHSDKKKLEIMGFEIKK